MKVILWTQSLSNAFNFAVCLEVLPKMTSSVFPMASACSAIALGWFVYIYWEGKYWEGWIVIAWPLLLVQHWRSQRVGFYKGWYISMCMMASKVGMWKIEIFKGGPAWFGFGYWSTDEYFFFFLEEAQMSIVKYSWWPILVQDCIN